MKYLLIFILAIAGGIGGSLVYNEYRHLLPEQVSFGATTARTTITNPWTFSATTTMSSNLIVTTTNSATSSIQVGCVQFYATSTATAHRFLASTTPGIMYSAYGTCPRI